MEIDNLFDVVSLSGSVFATVLTVFFWMVRARKEKADLRSYLVGRLDAGQSPLSREGFVRSTFWLKVIVANYSSLPNAVIGVRAWLKTSDGWRVGKIEEETEKILPLNLPAMQTEAFDLSVSIDTVGELSGSTTAGRREAALGALTDPPQIRIELVALGRARFRDVLVQEARPTS